MPILRPGSFLAGQIFVALLLRNPWISLDVWPWLGFSLCLTQSWQWLPFVLGGLWQSFWAPSELVSQCHPFFWFLCSGNSALDPLPAFFQGGLLDEWAESVTDHCVETFLKWDPQWGPWFLRFALGHVLSEADGWTDIYRDLGLLHVLVVSGSHFSFLGMIGPWLTEGPGKVLYSLRFMSFRVWLGWITLSRMLLTIGLTIFALVVGFNPPCQRSWLGILIQLWLPLLGAPCSARNQDRWVFRLQALFFPNSFLSLSNALSWSAYSLIRRLKPWPEAWQRRLLPAAEGPLIAVNLSYFAVFSPFGVILNPILEPLWNALFALGLLLLLWPHSFWGECLTFLLMHGHQFLLWVFHMQRDLEGLVSMKGQGWGLSVLRSLLWCGASWTFLDLWRRIPEREETC